MEQHPDPADLTVTVTALRAWPEDRLRRAHRLVGAAVRQLIVDGAPPPEVAAAEADAALFGGELVRRGLI